MHRGLAVTAAAILLATGAAAQPQSPAVTGWTQAGGGMGHAAEATIAEGPLDVVMTAKYGQGPVGEGLAMGLVPTPYGLAGVEAISDTCTGVFVDPTTMISTKRYKFDCEYARAPDISIAAYDPARDQLILCATSPPSATPQGGPDATASIVYAIDASTGERRWARTSEELSPTPSAVDPSATRPRAWWCLLPALDPELGQLIVPLTTGRPNPGDAQQAEAGSRIAVLDLDTGQVIHSLGLGQCPTAGGVGQPACQDPDEGFRAFSVSVTPGGILALGKTCDRLAQPGTDVPVDGEDTACQTGGAVWLRRSDDGLSVVARASAVAAGTPLAVDYGHSVWAASDGSRFAFALGRTLHVLDPADVATTALSFDPRQSSSFLRWGAPAWSGRYIVVPTADELVAYDERTERRLWRWDEIGSWVVEDVLIAEPDRVVALVTGNDAGQAGNKRTELYVLDLVTGQVAQRIPLGKLDNMRGALGHSRTASWPYFPEAASLLPLSDGRLLVHDSVANLVVLGATDPALRPRITASQMFPLPREQISLAVSFPSDPDFNVTSVRVVWGDGTHDQFDAQKVRAGTVDISHVYLEQGVFEAAVTLIAGSTDGRTATGIVHLDVGGTPPKKQTVLERAFASENQEVTFFVLGLTFTGIVGGYGTFVLRRRHNTFSDQMVAVEDAFQMTRHVAEDAEAALAHRKEQARDLLLARRLTDNQFAVVDKRIDELVAATRLQTIEARYDFLTRPMKRVLQSILADGRVVRLERDHFIMALDADKTLSKAQKAKLRDQIDQWFERDQASA